MPATSEQKTRNLIAQVGLSGGACDFDRNTLEHTLCSLFDTQERYHKMKIVRAQELKQTNAIQIIHRANELLECLKSLQLSQQECEDVAIKRLAAAKTDLDNWEEAAWKIVEIELMERRIRNDDPTVQKFPEGWNGGF